MRASRMPASKPAKDHARVIAECFKHSTVLPFRFGTTFQDDDALRRSVRSNQRHFQANVERLRGKAEMHLKVLVDDTCPGNSARNMTVGQEYLTSLRESASRQRDRQSKARALSVQMHRMFLPLAEEITCKRTDSGKMLLDIAHLIDNKTVERYQNKYSSATQELKECRMQLSGPWPPYHFVHRNQRSVNHQHGVATLQIRLTRFFSPRVYDLSGRREAGFPCCRSSVADYLLSLAPASHFDRL